MNTIQQQGDEGTVVYWHSGEKQQTGCNMARFSTIIQQQPVATGSMLRRSQSQVERLGVRCQKLFNEFPCN